MSVEIFNDSFRFSVCCNRKLQINHLVNRLFIFASCSKLAPLEQLEELDLSGNRLKAVPTTILSCRRLQTLSAHSNCINTFPEVLQLQEIKVCSQLFHRKLLKGVIE